MPSSPTLTRSAGITFMVMPPGPTPPSTTVSFIFDDHISDYGGVADGQFAIIPITTTVGSTIITVSSGIFVPGDVGKKLTILPFGGTDITIADYTSSTTITSASAINVTVTNSTHCVVWGTDNGSVAGGGNGAFDAFSAARSSLSSGTGRLRCSSGVYMIGNDNPLFRYVRNFVLDATNTTFAGAILQLGNPGQHQFDSSAFGGPYSARTTTATSGNSFVDLITSSLASIFTVGNYATMTGLDMQGGVSFPSNPYYYENLLISAVDNSSPSPTYGRISFATPLVNSYRTDWPFYSTIGGVGGIPDHGGPATLYAWYPEWNCEHTYNLAGQAVDTQPQISGKTMVYNNTTFYIRADNFATISPTQCNSVTFNNCDISQANYAIEIDKQNTLLIYNNCTINSMNFQSPNNQLRGTGNTITNMSGCCRDTSLSNCTITTISVGANTYGTGSTADTIALSNCVIGTLSQPGGYIWYGPYTQNVNSNGVFMSSGRITIPASLYSSNSNGSNSSDGTTLSGWAVPNGHYIWVDGNRNGFGTFKITSITTDSCGIQIQTDLSSGFPQYSTGAGNIFRIQAHPAPNFQLTACSATAPAGTNDNSLAYNLSQAGGARPLWSYWRQFNDASVVTTSGAPLWGWLSSATVTVTSDYTGADANPRLDPFGSFCWVSDPNSTASALSPGNYVPKISIASSAGTGTRNWSVGAYPSTSVTFTGFKAEDTGYTPLPSSGPPTWIANRVFGFLDNGVTTGSMSVVTEIKTDQGF